MIASNIIRKLQDSDDFEMANIKGKKNSKD